VTVDPHLGNDLLADFLEGLLADHEAAGVHAHLRACGSCQAVADSLSEVRLLLHDAGTRPAPMPVVVSDRLEAVIGAESAARGARASGAYEPSHVFDTAIPSGTSLGRARRMSRPGARRAKRRRPRWVPALAAAASVAALALGGGAVYSALSGAGTPTAQEPRPSSSTGAPNADTTFGFRPNMDATLSAGNFADQVDGLLERRRAPSPTPSKSFGPRQDPGIAPPGGSDQCVKERLETENAGKLLATRPAKLDGEAVTLALTETGKPGVVRAYAIDCRNAKIVRSATITGR
jgi:hypothetical protein